MITSPSAFDTIKETLNIADITAFYGIEVKRNNQALCPFHNERTPSFTIYPKTNSFKCFGCGVGGSVIDFTMLMHGIDALEAAKKLDMDYNLGLFNHNDKTTQEERYRLKKQLQEQQAEREATKGLVQTFEDYINKAHDILCDYAHMLRDWKVTHAPKSIEELDMGNLNPFFVEVCHELDYIEYLLDYLTYADYDEQILFYKHHKKEMVQIATKIKQHTESTKAD